MEATFNLVRAAIGDPELPITAARRRDPSGPFDLFDVNLPLPAFAGIPRQWVFAVLDKGRLDASPMTRQQILAEGHALIAALPRDKLIVLLSDDLTVHLADEFGNETRDVFCLDYNELPHTKGPRTPSRQALFILAIQRRLSIKPVLARAFSPYQRSKPASGWRFFGREKELSKIIDGSENLVLVGARRVGKTSLLLEAERRLKEDGRTVYYVDVENCSNANEVVTEILHTVSPRDLARATKHHGIFNEKIFSNVLRSMSAGPEKTYLFLDELGTVLAGRPKEDWAFMGLLRRFGSSGHLKYIITCFQELFFRQQTEFEGPLINFAHTFRLGVFSRKEVEDFLVAPIDFWKPLGKARNQFLDLILSNIGAHPYFLQHFCSAFFDRLAEQRDFDPLRQADYLLKRDLYEWFPTAVDEFFLRIPSVTLQYLFLRRCQDAETAGQPWASADFTDDWVEETLVSLGYRSNVRGRHNLLDGLEMHGLCGSTDHERTKKVVAAPLIYEYMRGTQESFDKWLGKLGKEIERERVRWELS